MSDELPLSPCIRHSNLFFMPETWLNGLGSTKIATLLRILAATVCPASRCASAAFHDPALTFRAREVFNLGVAAMRPVRLRENDVCPAFCDPMHDTCIAILSRCAKCAGPARPADSTVTSGSAESRRCRICGSRVAWKCSFGSICTAYSLLQHADEEEVSMLCRPSSQLGSGSRNIITQGQAIKVPQLTFVKRVRNTCSRPVWLCSCHDR